MSNMMGTMGLFGLKPVVQAQPKAAEKNETKKDEGKDSKTASKKTSGGQKLTGPVLCVGSGWTYVYGEEGKTYGAKVVAKALYDAGYTEIAASMKVYVSPTNKSVLVIAGMAPGMSLSGSGDSEVITKKVEVCTGLTKAEYTTGDFDGKDDDEVSLRDLSEKYVEAYPDFAGCKLAFSRAAQVAIPFFPNMLKKEDVKEDQKYRVWSVAEVAEVEGKDLEGMFGSSDYTVNFYVSDTGVLFPSYSTAKTVRLTEEDLGLKKAASKKAVEKYPLPAIIYVQAWGEKIAAEPSMFDGKDKVTQDDVIGFLKNRHRVFNQSDRKFDIIYDDVTNKISVAILSGKKGAATCAAPFFMSQATGEIVQNLPVGIFKGFAREDDIEDVSFEMSLPKIPYALLKGIVQDFRRDLTKEDIRQVVYDRNKDEYMVFRPVCKCTRTHIDYVFPKLLKSQVLAMTIHSHNTMPAWFSGTDDADEVVTGLYGVIGRLHEKEPQMSFRASLEGCFTPVDAGDIFSFMGGNVA